MTTSVSSRDIGYYSKGVRSTFPQGIGSTLAPSCTGPRMTSLNGMRGIVWLTVSSSLNSYRIQVVNHGLVRLWTLLPNAVLLLFHDTPLANDGKSAAFLYL
jgi:hypothetical protein